MSVQKRPEILAQLGIPIPLHSLAPRTLLGSAWWQAERIKAYTVANNHCVACGKKQKFQMDIHERYDINYKTYTMTYVESVALCGLCHQFIHLGFTASQVKEGILTPTEMMKILTRGTKILRKAGLTRPLPPSTVFLRTWDRWRLLINNVEYKSKFKNYESWRERYAS